MKKIIALLTLCALGFSHAIAAEKKPLKVFILAGQSNMEGHAKIETFDYIGDDAASAPLLGRMRNPDGNPRVCEKKLRAAWPIDREYMPQPTRGKLAALDPGLFVTPPKEMEIGYVPIVIRQEKAR